MFRTLNIIIALLLSAFLYSCFEKKSNSTVTIEKFKIRTSNSRIKSRFLRVKIIADSLASAIIAPERLGNFFCKYQFEYYDQQKYNNDSIEKQPTDYHITYRLIYKGDTIGSSGISIDSTLHITYCDIADLIGQKYFLEKKLTMTKAEALATAKLYGVDAQSARAKSETIFYSTAAGYNNELDKLNKIIMISDSLQKKELKFRWDVQNHCDGCTTIKIDAETGEVSDEKKWIFMY